MSAFTISSLWRYPVKSMAGEELNTVDVTTSGLRGDRAYALVDTANGKVGSAKSVKRFGELLKYQVQFVTQPESDGIVPLSGSHCRTAPISTASSRKPKQFWPQPSARTSRCGQPLPTA